MDHQNNKIWLSKHNLVKVKCFKLYQEKHYFLSIFNTTQFESSMLDTDICYKNANIAHRPLRDEYSTQIKSTV